MLYVNVSSPQQKGLPMKYFSTVFGMLYAAAYLATACTCTSATKTKQLLYAGTRMYSSTEYVVLCVELELIHVRVSAPCLHGSYVVRVWRPVTYKKKAVLVAYLHTCLHV